MNLFTITLLNYACHKQSQDCELKVNKYKDYEYLNKQGQCHRLDGPAYIGTDGSQRWCQKGQYHRLDGPAYIGADGYQAWYQKGLLHRLDGPAIVQINGYREWFVNNEQLTQEEFIQKIKQI